jgi:hypothetical protein
MVCAMFVTAYALLVGRGKNGRFSASRGAFQRPSDFCARLSIGLVVGVEASIGNSSPASLRGRSLKSNKSSEPVRSSATTSPEMVTDESFPSGALRAPPVGSRPGIVVCSDGVTARIVALTARPNDLRELDFVYPG